MTSPKPFKLYDTLEFIFDIAPQPKERPRFSNRGGFVRTHTAPKTRAFENTIAIIARSKMLGKPILEGELTANVVFEFKRPKKTKLASPKKDLDNLCKSLFDALNEIVYRDDTQICSLMALKRWSDRDRIKLLIGKPYGENNGKDHSSKKEDRNFENQNKTHN